MKDICLRKYQPGRALLVSRLVDATTSVTAFVKFTIHLDHTSSHCFPPPAVSIVHLCCGCYCWVDGWPSTGCVLCVDAALPPTTNQQVPSPRTTTNADVRTGLLWRTHLLLLPAPDETITQRPACTHLNTNATRKHMYMVWNVVSTKFCGH